jgi:hypothetical protein
MWWVDGAAEQEWRSRRKSEREGKGGGKGMWVVVLWSERAMMGVGICERGGRQDGRGREDLLLALLPPTKLLSFLLSLLFFNYTVEHRRLTCLRIHPYKHTYTSPTSMNTSEGLSRQI